MIPMGIKFTKRIQRELSGGQNMIIMEKKYIIGKKTMNGGQNMILKEDIYMERERMDLKNGQNMILTDF